MEGGGRKGRREREKEGSNEGGVRIGEGEERENKESV